MKLFFKFWQKHVYVMFDDKVLGIVKISKRPEQFWTLARKYCKFTLYYHKIYMHLTVFISKVQNIIKSFAVIAKNIMIKERKKIIVWFHN